jgi:hypothetical protein
MKKSILLSEPRMSNNIHILFNSGILSQLINLNDFEVNFISEKNHNKIIVNELKEKLCLNLKFKHFNNSFFIKPQIFFYSLFLSIKGNSKLVFLSITPSQLFFLHFFSFVFKKKITFIAHGDFGVLTKKNRGLKGEIFNLFLRFFLSTRRDNLQIVFVGETVFTKINDIISSSNKKNIFFVEHPITAKEIKQEKKIRDRIKVGSIGTALKIKNSELIFLLAEQISVDQSDTFEFRHIGSISNEILEFSNSYVKHNKSNLFLSDSLYFKELLDLDYILLFIKDGDYYDLCPSGTFTELIRCEKPVLCLKSSVSKFYFDKYGDIGYMFDDIESMKNGIINLKKNDSRERYKIQKLNLRKAKEKLLLNFDFLNLINEL